MIESIKIKCFFFSLLFSEPKNLLGAFDETLKSGFLPFRSFLIISIIAIKTIKNPIEPNTEPIIIAVLLFDFALVTDIEILILIVFELLLIV